MKRLLFQPPGLSIFFKSEARKELWLTIQLMEGVVRNQDQGYISEDSRASGIQCMCNGA